MKKLTSIIACAAFIVGSVPLASAVQAFSPPPFPPGGIAGVPGGGFNPDGAPSAPSCADTCGYAVVDSAGVVHGVIVCQEGCFGGTMPHEYMGCPAGCSLVLQAPADSTGNVAGVHGPNVVYTPDNNTFSQIGEDGQTNWSLVGGQPLDQAYVRVPESTIPPPTTTPEEQTPADPVAPSPELPITTAPPTTTAPEESTLQTFGDASVGSSRSKSAVTKKQVAPKSKKAPVTKKRTTSKVTKTFIR